MVCRKPTFKKEPISNEIKNKIRERKETGNYAE